jgi:hypothetical protein
MSLPEHVPHGTVLSGMHWRPLRTTPLLRHMHVDCDQATATIGPIGVVIWRGEMTPAGVERVREMGHLALEQQRSVGVIGIVENSSSVPCAAARKLHAKLNDELAVRGVVAYASVIPGSGFVGARARGVFTELTLMARNRCQYKAYETTQEACVWLYGLLDTSTLSWQLAATEIEAFRADYMDLWAPVTTRVLLSAN